MRRLAGWAGGDSGSLSPRLSDGQALCPEGSLDVLAVVCADVDGSGYSHRRWEAHGPENEKRPREGFVSREDQMEEPEESAKNDRVRHKVRVHPTIRRFKTFPTAHGENVSRLLQSLQITRLVRYLVTDLPPLPPGRRLDS